MTQNIQRHRIPSRRARLRKTLLPYASHSAFTSLQIIFLFVFFHDSTALRTVLYLFAVLLGAWGSVPLLKSLMRRKATPAFTLAVFQRSLPSVLLLAWGESHLLDSSYIPFNRMAIVIWLVYVAVGLFFGVVRAAHRARLLREMKRTARHINVPLFTTSETVKETPPELLPQRSAFDALSTFDAHSHTVPEQEAVTARRS